ncbi:MAG: hypothetical protein LBT00_13725 [Spirochaetaceae bacterium]|nr:hypothetical protein [Spirochaetaceae bacterium]
MSCRHERIFALIHAHSRTLSSPRLSLRASDTLPSEAIGSTLRVELVGATSSGLLRCFAPRNDVGSLSKRYRPKKRAMRYCSPRHRHSDTLS